MSDFLTQFHNAVWTPAESIVRSYVRYRNENVSGSVFKHLYGHSNCARLSVIIPTADADRDGYFQTLLRQIGVQSFQDYEMIVVKGDHRQGRSINVGAALASGEYILTLDDDSSLPDSETFAKLIDAMDSNMDIGMAGGNNTVPDWASPFVKRVMKQVPRRSWVPVTEITDSDLAEHPCLIMRSDLFRAVGGENEHLPRGLDPYLRKQFRDAGARVVLLPGVIYHHLPPQTWKKLLVQFYRNGYQAAYANIHYPEWVIETPSKHGKFVEKVPIWKRIARYQFRMLASLFSCQWIWLSCQICYGIGFLIGWQQERKKGQVRA
jgi:glycosyltransferase involved in cell wall biosynthesis